MKDLFKIIVIGEKKYLSTKFISLALERLQLLTDTVKEHFKVYIKPLLAQIC